MRKDLAILPWFTTSEALIALKDMTGINMDDSTLLSQCEHGNCEVYAFIDGKTGWSESLVFPASDEPVPYCYAIGPQKVMNPAALRHSDTSQLLLAGSVFLAPEDPETRYDSLEWQPQQPLANSDLRYPNGSIKSLAEKILATSPKLMDPRELKSIVKIIAVMAAEAKIDLTMPYKAAEVLTQLAAQHGVPLTLTEDTIAKYLKLAQEA